jgi:hypothetical protein
MKMLRLIALAIVGAAFAPAMAATGPVTEEEARAIGVDAYLYFYPIVTMDMTRKQLTNLFGGGRAYPQAGGGLLSRGVWLRRTALRAGK